ncbi:MAG: glycerophosphodiester phosphodiesterase family protein, partial [Angelakisella sp.]
MLAFAKAVECGCDGIELDVQLTADGQVVVIHDEKIDRTTDGHGNVRDMTLDELRRYNACGTRAESFAVQTIPTLREYFEYMQDKRQITNIELKNSIFDYPGMEEKVLMLAKEY